MNLKTSPAPPKWSSPIPGISYARVSSERQLSGEGLGRQLRGTTDWIKANPEYPIRLDLTLTDEARSAWKGDHVGKDGALGKMLEMVRAGTIKRGTVLLVEALDRLSRQNVWNATHQLTGLVSAGITVITTADNKIYSDDPRFADKGSAIGDLLLSVVKMANAHEESEKKSGRIRDTKAQRAIEAQTTKNVLHQNTSGWRPRRPSNVTQWRWAGANIVPDAPRDRHSTTFLIGLGAGRSVEGWAAEDDLPRKVQTTRLGAAPSSTTLPHQSA